MNKFGIINLLNNYFCDDSQWHLTDKDTFIELSNKEDVLKFNFHIYKVENESLNDKNVYTIYASRHKYLNGLLTFYIPSKLNEEYNYVFFTDLYGVYFIRNNITVMLLTDEYQIIRNKFGLYVENHNKILISRWMKFKYYTIEDLSEYCSMPEYLIKNLMEHFDTFKILLNRCHY